MKKIREPIYFYILKDWYRGNMPVFYASNKYDFQNTLENNYHSIKNEIIEKYSSDSKIFIPQHAPPPYKFDNDRWKICTFYGFLLKYENTLKEFPVIAEVLKKIPHLITAQISVLEPHTKIKPHFGSSNAVIRSHLAIQIPGKLPELGMKMLHEERSWEEGKVVSFCETYRHYVWNNTDYPRIVLLIDTIHPDYIDKKYFICGGVLSSQVLKIFVEKLPFTKTLPDFITLIIHRFFTYALIVIVYLQNIFEINIANISEKLKRKHT